MIVWSGIGILTTGTIDDQWITPTASTLGLTESVHGVFCKTAV